MATRTEYAHGDFCWVDLATTDPASAKEFYGAIFGWTFDDMPAGPGMIYTMSNLRGHAAAGMYRMTAEMFPPGVPPHWLPYVTVRNADETAQKAAHAGGKVLKDPFDVMDAGRMSVVQDPTSAVFAMWQANRHAGAGIINEPGAMCWNELATSDVDAAGKFYRETIGWTTNPMDMGEGRTYTIFKSGDTQVGGMMALTPQMHGVPPHWLTYFAVNDCDATVKMVAELGGKVLMGPADVPNVGRFAVCWDRQRAAFAVIKLNM
jgi:predicted enzyme related to lactoylglutathione lyase